MRISGGLKHTTKRRKGAMGFEVKPLRDPRGRARFQVCVWIGKSLDGSNSYSCVADSNPRKAFATALRSLANNKLDPRRRGAFRGTR